MHDKSDRPGQEQPAAAAERREDKPATVEGAEPREAVDTALVEAYQRAHRQLFDAQAAFQRAMTDTQMSFLKAMEDSLAGLKDLSEKAGIDLPGAPGGPAPPQAAPPRPPAPPQAAPPAARAPALKPLEAESIPLPDSPPVWPKAEADERDEEAPAVEDDVEMEAASREPALVEEAEIAAALEAEYVAPESTVPEPAAPEPAAPEPPAPADEEILRQSAALADEEFNLETVELSAEAVKDLVASSETVEDVVMDKPPPTAAAAGTPAAGSSAAATPFGRFALQAAPSAPAGLAMSGLAATSFVAVTDEGTGIAKALAEQLQARGVAAEVVTRVPSDASGVILLGGLRRIASLEDTVEASYEAFRAAKAVAQRFTTGRGVFVTVQDTGGDFGLSGRAGERAGLGALAGLAKTARLEWPGVTVKAIDLERGGRPAWKLAKILAEELFGGGPELEVGLHADGGRTTLESYQALLKLGKPSGVYSVVNRSVLKQSSVIVASGGARGVTAATLIALARNARPRMVLLGRMPLVEEPAVFHGLDGEDEISQALAEQALASGHETSPEELAERVGRMLAAREIRANLTALRQAGSRVSYFEVDVQDAAAVAAALDEVRSEWGPITGIIHGAGIEAESLIAEKTEDEFAAIFNPKVRGLLSLLHATGEDPIELVLLFSSAAARLGRRGHADYAMANEVLNKVAATEHARRGASCLVKSLNWSHWQAAAADPSMETPPGRLIPTDVGARMMVEEIQASVPDQVEVVLGVSPPTGPIARPSSLTMLTMDAFASAATHPFLEGYRFDDIPSLPMVLVLEWFNRITRAHCPDLEMVACRDLKILRGVRLEGFYGGGDAFTVVSHQYQRGSGRELRLELYARDGSLRYSAVADMASPGSSVSTSRVTARSLRAAQNAQLRPWPFSSVYGHALHHGAECQVIREIKGVSDEGIIAVLAGSREMGWSDDWRTDVAALEGGLQLAMLWFQYQLGGASLPTAVGSYHRHFSGLLDGPVKAVLRGQNEGFQRVICDVIFVNENGTLVMELRGVEARAYIKPATTEIEVPIELETGPEAGESSPPEVPETPPGDAVTAETTAKPDEEPEESGESDESEEPDEPDEPDEPEESEEPEFEEPDAAAPAPAAEDEPPTPREQKTERILAALDALAGRINSNDFLAFATEGREKLLRFVGGEGELYLDLPGQMLDPEEMKRAEAYFEAIGVEKQSTEIYEGGQLANQFESFGVEFGGDTQRATEMVLDVFFEIYRLPEDFPLEIDES